MTVSPIVTADTALAEASSEVLLDALVVMTHQIHALSELSDGSPGRVRADELREQRDLIRGELLARLPKSGGAR